MSPIKVLKVSEVADMLRVSEWTVYEMIKRGDLKGMNVGRCKRVKESDLEEFLNLKGK